MMREAQAIHVGLLLILALTITGVTPGVVRAIPYDSAFGIDFNARNNRIYAPTEHDSILVIDAATQTIIADRATGPSQLMDLRVNPDTRWLYVADFAGGRVLAMHEDDDTILPILTQNGASGIWINRQTNTIFVTNFLGGTVSIIDGATHSVLEHVPVPDTPITVVVNHLTGLAYVAHWEGSKVSVIDESTRKVVGTIAVPPFPKGMHVSHELNRIYISHSQGISVFDGETNNLIDTIVVPHAGPRSDIEITRWSRRIYASGRGTLDIIDRDTHAIIDSVYYGHKDGGVAGDGQAQRVYFAHRSIETGDSGGLIIYHEKELLRNASLDGLWTKDDVVCRRCPWKGINLSAGDGPTTHPAHVYESARSFRIASAPDMTKGLEQIVRVSGPSGETLHIEGANLAEGSSGTLGSIFVELRITYTDDTSERVRAAFSKDPHGWERREASVQTRKPYKRLTFRVVTANQTGKTWFDALHLWKD